MIYIESIYDNTIVSIESTSNFIIVESSFYNSGGGGGGSIGSNTIDGGVASSIYLTSQIIDGGNA